MGKATGGLVQQGFCNSGAKLQSSTVVLRLNCCAKLKICASIAPPSQSPKTLCVTFERQKTKRNMKIKFILFTIIILNLSCNSKSKDKVENKVTIESFDSINNLNKDFERNYIGTINKKINVVFHLKSINGIIKGFYFYQEKGIDIKLKGKLLNNKMVLDEFDFFDNKVAQITLEENGKKVFGEWHNSKSNKILKVDLEETEKKIVAFPKNIEGVYKTENSENKIETCNLILTITKKNGKYSYNYKSESRTLNGKVSFYRDIDEAYITLEGIKWAEYEGDVTNQGDENYEEKDLELPIGIDGSLSENEILIQNDGNAMNYYVKLNDCGVKYIHLKK